MFKKKKKGGDAEDSDADLKGGPAKNSKSVKKDTDETHKHVPAVSIKLVIVLGSAFMVMTLLSVGVAIKVLLYKSPPTKQTVADASVEAPKDAPAAKDAEAPSASTAAPEKESAETKSSKSDDDAAPAADAEKKPESSPEGSKAEGGEQVKANYYSIKPAFIVNYQVKGRTRFLQVGVDVQAKNEQVMQLLEKQSPRIKNDLILLFSSQDFDGLQSLEGKEKLRADALTAVQNILQQTTGDGSGAQSVLFTSFVMQ